MSGTVKKSTDDLCAGCRRYTTNRCKYCKQAVCERCAINGKCFYCLDRDEYYHTQKGKLK